MWPGTKEARRRGWLHPKTDDADAAVSMRRSRAWSRTDSLPTGHRDVAQRLKLASGCHRPREWVAEAATPWKQRRVARADKTYAAMQRDADRPT